MKKILVQGLPPIICGLVPDGKVAATSDHTNMARVMIHAKFSIHSKVCVFRPVQRKPAIRTLCSNERSNFANNHGHGSNDLHNFVALVNKYEKLNQRFEELQEEHEELIQEHEETKNLCKTLEYLLTKANSSIDTQKNHFGLIGALNSISQNEVIDVTPELDIIQRCLHDSSFRKFLLKNIVQDGYLSEDEVVSSGNGLYTFVSLLADPNKTETEIDMNQFNKNQAFLLACVLRYFCREFKYVGCDRDPFDITLSDKYGIPLARTEY